MPLAKHHPATKTCATEKKFVQDVSMPELSSASSMESENSFETWALEIYEWISLVGLESPRIYMNDAIDPYLSRYQTPKLPEAKQAINMVSLTWRGLLPGEWIRSLFIQFRQVLLSIEVCLYPADSILSLAKV